MKCIRLLFGIVMLLCVAASRCFAPPPLVTGDESRGLGSGEFDYDLRLRTQKTWGWFTAIGNVGYTIVTDPEYRSVQQSAENVWLLAFGQEYQVAKRTKLLSEIYFVSREEPGEPNRLAANIGFKHKLLDKRFRRAFGRTPKEFRTEAVQ